jgi:hypothetical protein
MKWVDTGFPAGAKSSNHYHPSSFSKKNTQEKKFYNQCQGEKKSADQLLKDEHHWRTLFLAFYWSLRGAFAPWQSLNDVIQHLTPSFP